MLKMSMKQVCRHLLVDWLDHSYYMLKIFFTRMNLKLGFIFLKKKVISFLIYCEMFSKKGNLMKKVLMDPFD